MRVVSVVARGACRSIVVSSVLFTSIVFAMLAVPEAADADSYVEEAIIRPIVTFDECDVDALEIGDTDGDGEMELVVACEVRPATESYGSTELFVYGWDGVQYVVEWSSGPIVVNEAWGDLSFLEDLVLGDADGDGCDDIFIRGYSHFYDGLMHVGIAFTWQQPTGYEMAWSMYEGFSRVALSDGDMDGEVELYGVGAYCDLSVYELDGIYPVFSAQYPLDEPVTDISVADIDSDSEPEIVMGDLGLRFRSYEWNGSEYYQDHLVSTPDMFSGLGHLIGDYDSDGVTEVAKFNVAGTIRVCEWTETYFREEWYREITTYSVHAYALAEGDTDGDGAPEMVMSRDIYTYDPYAVGGALDVFGYDGGAYCTEWSSEDFDAVIVSLAVGDIDGDGWNEIVAGHAGSGEVRVMVQAPVGSPHAALTVTPEYAEVGESFTFNASSSSDPEDGQDLEYRWDWEGDGTWDLDWSIAPVSEHQYDLPSIYFAILQVRDSAGLTDLATASVQVFEVDTDPPFTTAILSCDEGIGDDGWYLGPTWFWLEAVDNSSGVSATYLNIDGGGWSTVGTSFFSVDSQSNISYYSVDMFGNVEPTKTLEIKIDTMAPWTSVNVDGELGDGGWYVTAVNVTLYATDYGSGVESTLVSIDDGPFEDYTGPLNFDESGTHDITYYSVDFAGHEAPSCSVEIQLDVDAPSLEVSPAPEGLEESDSLLLELAASDVNGIDRIDVFYDGDGPMVYGPDATNITIPELKAGDHTVSVVAYDYAGNSQEVVVTFSVSGVGIPRKSTILLLSSITAAASAAIAAAYYLIMVRPSRPQRPPGQGP